MGRLLTVLGFVIVTAVLYLGREILIPIAMAVLISFLLSPLVLYLERRKVKRPIAVVLVVAVLMSLVGGFGYLLVGQFVEFVDNLPKYRTNIVTKIHTLKPGKESVFKRAEAIMVDLTQEIDAETTGTETGNTTGSVVADSVDGSTVTVREGVDDVVSPAVAMHGQMPNVGFDGVTSTQDRRDALGVISAAQSGNTKPPAPDKAIPVKVVAEPASPWQSFQEFLGPILAILGNAGLVILFVIFFLVQREDLRDRIIRLAGQNKVRVTTEALEESAKRVSRYLLMQLIVNVTYGIPIAIGLFFIGVPNALLWGAMATVLRFIPYVGPWIAAAMPIALSLAVFDNWTMPILTVALFVVMEIISNNILEPILYGNSTGVSPVAIIVSAVFWTWLWGAVGLVLATPITVCLVVLGSYIPQLAFLQVLLGDEPVLTEDARIYNRLLSGATDEAVEVAEEYGEGHTMAELYDNVLMVALESAETDRTEELLSVQRYEKFIGGMKELIEESHSKHVREKQKAKIAAGEVEATAGAIAVAEGEVAELDEPNGSPLPGRRIVCIPVNDATDECAAVMLKYLLLERNYDVKVMSPGMLVSELADAIREFKADSIVLSSVPPFAVTHSRYLAKRITSQFPDVKLYAGLWRGAQTLEKSDERLKDSGVEKIYTSLTDAGQYL